MKILTIVLVGLFLTMGIVEAQELSISDSIKKIPALKQGIGYSLIDNDVSYLSTLEVLNWKGIALEAGYSSKDKAVAVVSYELLKLKDLGVSVPLLDLVTCRVGAYAGYGSINSREIDRSEFDTGLSLTLISLKI